MKPLLPLLLALSLPLAAETRNPPKLADSPGPVNIRYIAGVVPHDAGIDVYSVRQNQFIAEVGKLWRTTVSRDGASRLAREVVRELPSGYALIAGPSENLHVLWPGNYYEVLTSPIVNDAVKYPQGKLATAHGMYPRLTCDASQCVTIYEAAGKQWATFLDADGNAIGSPITLPDGYHPLAVSLDERGVLFVRRNLNELRAALVRRDGSVQYDVVITSTDTAAFAWTPLAIGKDGAPDVIAFIDVTVEPKEAHVVMIAADGTVSTPIRLMPLPTGLASISLVRNGSTWLLGGDAVEGKSFVMRFDSAFQPLDSEPILGVGAPLVQADGTNFVIVWDNHAAPYLTILKSDGQLTPPLPIDPAIRRRSVR